MRDIWQRWTNWPLWVKVVLILIISLLVFSAVYGYMDSRACSPSQPDEEQCGLGAVVAFAVGKWLGGFVLLAGVLVLIGERVWKKGKPEDGKS
jgi:hypothetical protein